MKFISLYVTSFAFLPGFGNCRFPLATGATVIGPVAKDLLEETYPSKMDDFWEGDAGWIYSRCISWGLYKGHKTRNSREKKHNTSWPVIFRIGITKPVNCRGSFGSQNLWFKMKPVHLCIFWLRWVVQSTINLNLVGKMRPFESVKSVGNRFPSKGWDGYSRNVVT